jgi:hypothetical protein
VSPDRGRARLAALVSRLPFIAAALGLLACTDAVDRAAKRRIFSPEDPPQAVAAATQKLPPEEAADNPAIARRILGMGAAETTQRIGPHHASAFITYEWSAGGKTVRLKESRELIAGQGGVGGDFLAKLFNANDMGLEVTRVKGQVFARSTYGKQGAGRFRERKRDRGMAERMREEVFGAVRDFDAIFRGRLKLTAQGTSSYEGRTAWKYSVELSPKGEEVPSRLPGLLVPKGGVDETTGRRLAFYRNRQPKTLQGELLVDGATSVVLRAKLDGRLTVASGSSAGAEADGGAKGAGDGVEAELRLVLDATLADVGKTPTVVVPDDYLPDEDKPPGIAAALERFGIERAIPDGGVPAPKKTGAPDDGPDDDN